MPKPTYKIKRAYITVVRSMVKKTDFTLVGPTPDLILVLGILNLNQVGKDMRSVQTFGDHVLWLKSNDFCHLN